MSRLKVNGKEIVAVTKTEEGRINLFITEDGVIFPYYVLAQFIKKGKTEGLMVHSNQYSDLIISATRTGEFDISDSIDDLPVVAQEEEEDTPITIDGENVVAIKEAPDNTILSFKLESGRELLYSDALEYIMENKSTGLNIHWNANAGIHIISAIRGAEPDNLKALARF